MDFGVQVETNLSCSESYYGLQFNHIDSVKAGQL